MLAVLFLSLATAAPAAPAPFPPAERGRISQAVFDAGTTERVKLALLYLRSDAFLDELMQTDAVNALPRVGGILDRRKWLVDNLVVEAKDTFVTVRLRDGGREASLALQAALVDLLVVKPNSSSGDPQLDEARRWIVGEYRDEYRHRFQVLRKLFRSGKACGSIEDLRYAEREYVRYEFEAEPLKLHRSTRRDR
jgi:hypothetical protein